MCYFFAIPIVVAVFHSVFGIKALFEIGSIDSIKQKAILFTGVAVATILFLTVIEFFYLFIVQKMGRRQLHYILFQKREDS